MSTPRAQLSLFDSASMIVGIIIGAGIYQTTPLIAKNVSGSGMLLLVWLAGGVIALVGALCYAELATTYPRQGGDYVYLQRAYGNGMAYLFAWAEFWVVRPCNIGAMAYVFAQYAQPLLPLGVGRWQSVTLAAVGVTVLSVLNLLGVRAGTWTQNVLTTLKVVGLLAVFAVGLTLPWWHTPGSVESAQPQAANPESPRADDTAEPTNATVSPRDDQATADDSPTQPSDADSQPAGGANATEPEADGPPPPSLALAMILVMFTYGGWSDMSYVAAEVRDPRRNILRALVLGTLAVSCIYLLVNLAFIRGLGFAGVQQSDVVAADLLAVAGGTTGRLVISVLICVSCLGAINGMLFTGARIYYALGKDHPGLGWLGQLSARSGSPVPALIAESVIVLMLIVGFGVASKNSFERLVVFSAPLFWTFFVLTGVALFVLRRTDTKATRSFLVPWYPLTPILFCATSLWMAYGSWKYALSQGHWEGLFALAVVVCGLVFAWWGTRRGEPR